MARLLRRQLIRQSQRPLLILPGTVQTAMDTRRQMQSLLQGHRSHPQKPNEHGSGREAMVSRPSMHRRKPLRTSTHRSLRPRCVNRLQEGMIAHRLHRRRQREKGRMHKATATRPCTGNRTRRQGRLLRPPRLRACGKACRATGISRSTTGKITSLGRTPHAKLQMRTRLPLGAPP